MSSGPFVEEDDVFDITVHFVEKNGETLVIPDKKEGCQSLTVTFKYPDFQTSQQIIQASTMVNDAGVPTVNYMQLQNSLVYMLATKWDAKDKDNKPIPLTNIGSLKVNIAKALVEMLAAKIGAVSIM